MLIGYEESNENVYKVYNLIIYGILFALVVHKTVFL